jgi:hypothetical protein
MSGLVDHFAFGAIEQGGSQRRIKRALLVPWHDKVLQASVDGAIFSKQTIVS